MTTLYRAYDAAGALLYVGIAEDWRVRLRSHERYSPWFDAADSLVIDHWPDRRAAGRAETEAIRAEQPLWNVRCSPNPRAALALRRTVRLPQPWAPSMSEAEAAAWRADWQRRAAERIERLWRLERNVQHHQREGARAS